MAPRHMPQLDGDRVELIRSFRPSGSATVVSLWDAGAGVRLPMLRWGDSIYSPVYEGMRFAVEVYNGHDRMIAVPTYVEGANLWVGGPADPEACSPSHMWEIEPRKVHRMDALMNPAGQRGRPIVITRTGFGATVGEATFGTDAFRGQLRIYERQPIVRETAGPAAPPSFTPGVVSASTVGAAAPAPRPHAPAAAPAALAPPAPPAQAAKAAPPMAAMPAPSHAPMAPPGVVIARAPAMAPAPSAPPRLAAGRAAAGPAGFGAGEEEVRHHQFTGVEYHRQALAVLSLRIEMRDDLEEMVRARLGPAWGWQWPATWGDDWTAHPWMWPVSPTAPHIPVSRPGPR